MTDGADGTYVRRSRLNRRRSIIAACRADRPRDEAAAGAAEPSPIPCPFCPGNEHHTPPEVEALRDEGSEGAAGWRARAFPSRYPIIPGGHEVIVHSPRHDAELEDLSEGELEEVLCLWRRRITAHLDAGAAAAVLIVNRGPGAGASLAHPHAQLLATGFVPSLLADEVQAFHEHAAQRGGCVLCDEFASAGGRLVFGGETAAFVPAAPRFDLETWIGPAAHQADVREADLGPVARGLRRALVAATAATGGAPMNLWLHSSPACLPGPFHWHIELAPRTAAVGGLELGADVSVVTVPPEEAAARLRAALPPP